MGINLSVNTPKELIPPHTNTSTGHSHNKFHHYIAGSNLAIKIGVIALIVSLALLIFGPLVINPVILGSSLPIVAVLVAASIIAGAGILYGFAYEHEKDL